MTSYSLLLTISIGVLFSIIRGSHAETADSDLTRKKEALNFLTQKATEMCQQIPVEGSGTNVELTGAGKVELNEVIKKLIDVNGNAAIKYKSDEYTGVLQKDLAGVLKYSANCKIEFLKLFHDDLFPNKDSSGNNISSREVSSTSDATGSNSIDVSATRLSAVGNRDIIVDLTIKNSSTEQVFVTLSPTRSQSNNLSMYSAYLSDNNRNKFSLYKALGITGQYRTQNPVPIKPYGNITASLIFRAPLGVEIGTVFDLSCDFATLKADSDNAPIRNTNGHFISASTFNINLRNLRKS